MRKNYFVLLLFLFINLILRADNSLLKLNLNEIANDFINESLIKYPKIENLYIINKNNDYFHEFLEESLKEELLLKNLKFKENHYEILIKNLNLKLEEKYFFSKSYKLEVELELLNQKKQVMYFKPYILIYTENVFTKQFILYSILIISFISLLFWIITKRFYGVLFYFGILNIILFFLLYFTKRWF